MGNIDLKGRAAVVTGGARGIGFSIAERFAASGAAVAIWDVDQAALQKAVASLAGAGRIVAEAADVTQPASIAHAAASTRAKLGGIDILVNNAGIAGPNASTWEYDPADWRKVIEINLIGVYTCCRAIVPMMLEKGYGRIVNIASVAGKEGNPNASAYSASKAGVIALTKSLGKELATRGILVNCITPAAAKTDIFKQMTEQHIQYMLSKIPMNRFVETTEIAAMAAWLASDECSFTTGGVFDISGGRATY
ncbi:MAG TPA: SDR family NAD(P)-dependent oxidoreductase [Candidatus Cybelea sp.]|nr:SDR family NAD(P)-dependent oxidoreductase [Candidatus Cybelea sp.]